MQQIKSFGVLQTSKVMGVIYFFFGVVAAIVFMLHFAGLRGPHHSRLLIFFLFVPFLYGVGGFVVTAVMCGVYNLVSRRFGGIEIELAP